MTKGNIVGEEFEEYVFNQIDVRQSINGASSQDSLINRDPKYLNYLNNRNAWVKMASGVALTDKNQDKNLPEGSKGLDRLKNISKDLLTSNGNLDLTKYNTTGLAKNFVLFNTLSNLNFKNETNKEFSNYTFRSGIQKSQQTWLDVDSSYGLGGTAMGLQPTPGIIDVSVDCVNRGSIRKATVTLKAFNKFQFSLIEMLYLRLGYTMMLEWGWDKYAVKENDSYVIKDTENTIIEDVWFKDISPTQTQMISTIETYREKYNGNYDGFFGKINNFTWNFNHDGSYDITINLITLGDVIESLKVNIDAPIMSGDLLDDQQKKLKDKDIDKNSSIYNSLGTDVLSRKLSHLVINYNNTDGKNKKLIKFSEYMGVSAGTIDGKTKAQETPPELDYFITLGDFLEMVKESVIPTQKSSNQTLEKLIDIDTNRNLNYINCYFNQIPFDPKVCIFNTTWGKTFIDKYPDLNDKTKGFPLHELNDLPHKFSIYKEGFVAGKLMNVYMNVDFLIKKLNSNTNDKGDLSLYKLIESICSGLNNALGNINNIEPVIKDDKTLTIIDQNPIPKIEKFIESTPSTTVTEGKGKNENPFLEVYGYNKGKSNFLKDIKFQTKIDNSLASMISIGATADGSSTKNYDATAFSKWNVGLKDRFSPPIFEPKVNLTATGVDLDKYRETAKKWAEENISTNYELGDGDYWLIESSNEYIEDYTFSKNYYLWYKKNRYSKEYAISTWLDRVVALKLLKDEETKDKETLNQLVNGTYAIVLSDIFGRKINISVGDQKYNSNVTSHKYQFLFTNNDLVQKVKSSFKAYITETSNTKYTDTNSPSGNIGFIPVSFDLTLEGLSGVKIYNKLNIDTRFLPPNYGESLDFLITKVNHKISSNNWDTVLGTISTSNLKDAKEESLSDGARAATNDQIVISDFATRRGGTTRAILGTIYTNGEVPDDKLRPINNPNKYKGSIQSDGGRIRLFTEASIALDKLLEKAESDGIIFRINSAYRTLNDQERVKKVYGDIAATPGTSNHGFGLAVDFATTNFSKITPQDSQYKWLAQNGADFGFKRLNFAGKKDGEAWESWHWEYQVQKPKTKNPNYSFTKSVSRGGGMI